MYYVSKQPLRLIYVGRDIELRIISLLVRASEVAEETVFIDLGSNDQTVDLATEFGCRTLHYVENDFTTPDLARLISNSNLDDNFANLIIHISDDWRLRELPVVVNRSREGWDIYIAYNNQANQELVAEELVIGSLDFDHIYVSSKGLEELAKANTMTSTLNFPSNLRVRVIESSDKIKLPQRESLATASRFAQLFYWMLETKHPLFLFGIPGLVHTWLPIIRQCYRYFQRTEFSFNRCNSYYNCDDANRFICYDGCFNSIHNGKTGRTNSIAI